MFERFTAPARATVLAARQLAEDEYDTHIRPDHLMLALLADDDSLAVQVLEGVGAPRERVVEALVRRRSALESGLGEDDVQALAAIGIDVPEVLRRIEDNLGGLRPPPHRGAPRFAPGSKKALELALREAIALHHRAIGSEHILLGIVRGGDPVVGSVLEELGVSGAALRRAVADARREAG
jgi:ATP-dependent Clp protease ATP-binding subunit ClpA